MFALMRKPIKTRGELLREELNETVDHAMRAAGHAAGGVNATVGPRMAAAREAMAPRLRQATDRGRSALTPLSEAAQTKVGGRRRKAIRAARRRRWTRFAGLLAGGVAVGVVVAAAVRRRRYAPELPPGATPEPENLGEAEQAATAPPASEPVSARDNRHG